MFNKKLEKIVEKLVDEQRETSREIDKRLDNIEKVMILQENNLTIHMQRSEHLESIVESLQEKEIKPIRRHISMVEGALKVVGGLGLLVTILGGIVKLFGVI